MDNFKNIDLYFELINKAITKDISLNLRQLGVLLYLKKGENTPSVKAIAAYFKIPKPSITRALDHLENNSLIKREISGNDKRVIFASLTEKGNDFINQL